ncbi:MAG: radical SAM protein, partial [Bacteroides sp.]|nr:radical SAM protein [Bacteroides sp.]
MKEALIGKTIAELKEIVKELTFPAFSANQIASWLYQKNITSIDEMTNLSLKQREQLKERFVYGTYAPSEVITSIDGTKKYLYHVQEKCYIETVYIPDKERATLCVSSQVGCKMNCKFCMTGKQGFRANLPAQHIMNQIISLPERDKLTNIVYMGMGEPMDNLDEVLKSLDILTGKYGFNWSPKRITVSTIGVKKGIHRFMEESDCHLAISLHSPIPAQRKELMPVEKSNPVKEILEFLR